MDRIVEYSECLVRAKKFKQAILVYTEWLNTNLDNPDVEKHDKAIAYNNRGHLKYLEVDFEGAVDDYNEALTYDSTLPCAYYNRGTIMYRMGYFDKAVEDMIVSARLAPNCVEFQLALQRCTDQLIIVHGPLRSEENHDSSAISTPREEETVDYEEVEEEEGDDEEEEEEEEEVDPLDPISVKAKGLRKTKSGVSVSSSNRYTKPDKFALSAPVSKSGSGTTTSTDKKGSTKSPILDSKNATNKTKHQRNPQSNGVFKK